MKAGICKLPRVRRGSDFRSISPSIRAVAEFAVKMKSRASQKDGMFGLSEYDRQVKWLVENEGDNHEHDYGEGWHGNLLQGLGKGTTRRFQPWLAAQRRRLGRAWRPQRLSNFVT
jgi:hypothetical protein